MNAVVAIAGRPNVGKSTLFNRLLGRRKALVLDTPGVTRDRLFGWVGEAELPHWLVDTGGLTDAPGGTLAFDVTRQALVALSEATVVLFVCDVRDGVTVADREIARRLRVLGKPTITVVNKMDPGADEAGGNEFFECSVGPLIRVSAEHGLGIDRLREEIISMLPPSVTPEPLSPHTAVAFLGRPNVGKSSLINTILDEPRLLVSQSPGTTRDVVDVTVTRGAETYLLLDTAGIRRKHKVAERIEYLTVIRSLQAVSRADVVCLVIDATASMTVQDERVAGAVLERKCGMIVLANKWDLMTDSPGHRADFRRRLYTFAPFLSFAPVLFVSAKTGAGVKKILGDVRSLHNKLGAKVPKAELDTVFERVSVAHRPGGDSGFRLRLFGLTQVESTPIFVVWCNDPRLVDESYARYWRNRVTAEMRRPGVPVSVVFRRKRPAPRGRRGTTPRRKARG